MSEHKLFCKDVYLDIENDRFVVQDIMVKCGNKEPIKARCFEDIYYCPRCWDYETTGGEAMLLEEQRLIEAKIEFLQDSFEIIKSVMGDLKGEGDE